MTEEFAIFGVFGGVLFGTIGLFLSWKKREDELKSKRKKVRVRSNRRF